MTLKQESLFYDLSVYLVEQKEYDVLYFNIKENEIWLSKTNNKEENIIRIINKRFDWKNRLKSDMATVFQRAKSLKKFYSQKVVNIANIYITDLEPVDDWKELLKPLKLKDKVTYNMSVFYLTNENYLKEIERLNKIAQINYINDENIQQEQNELRKKLLVNNVHKQRKHNKEIFTYGKPYFTFLLIAINLFIFILLEIRGGSTDVPTLIELGAKYNPAMVEGEWWRTITSMFLHIGFLHLFMNMLALYYLGSLLERIYGSRRFILIYFLSGIGGSLASFALSTSVSAGASGALFGLFGALLFFGINYKKLFFQTIGKNVILILILNLFIGIVIPNIDMSAHLGGLITGFLAAAIVSLPNKKNYKLSLISVIVYLIISASLVFTGINYNENDSLYLLMQTEESISEEKYEAAIDYATEGLKSPSDIEPDLLFQRAYAYAALNELDLAQVDLEKCVKKGNHFPEAYHNLAIINYQKDDIEQAKINIDKAMSQTSEQDSFKEIYDKIMQSEEWFNERNVFNKRILKKL